MYIYIRAFVYLTVWNMNYEHAHKVIHSPFKH